MGIGDVAILLLLAIILLVLSPILVPLFLFIYIKEKIDGISFRRYLSSLKDSKFFAYTARKTSQDFVRNLILPELPADAIIIFLSDKGKMILSDDVPFQYLIVSEMRKADGGFPYISKVVDGRFTAQSINKKLYSAINRGIEPQGVVTQIQKFYLAD